jgi:hypothetical protein
LNGDKKKANFLTLLIIIIVIAVFGLLIWSFSNFTYDQKAMLLAMTTIILAFVTFFGCLSFSQSVGGYWDLNKDGMRIAIAATVVVVYFFLLGVGIFAYERPPSTMTNLMVSNLTNFVWIILGFYFAASAFVQVYGKDNPKL